MKDCYEDNNYLYLPGVLSAVKSLPNRKSNFKPTGKFEYC